MSKSANIRKDSPLARPAKGAPAGKAAKTARRRATSHKADSPARNGTKQAILIDLLQRPNGATIEQMTAKTGWQPHSVRGFLAGTVKKKLGLPLISERPGDGPRRYRVLADLR